MVTFGRYFLGGGGAVHGGAISLLFDEVLGRLASSGDRAPARTAYLHTDYRSITPIGEELAVRAWFVSEQGRKRILRATITHGDTLCAEAEDCSSSCDPTSPEPSAQRTANPASSGHATPVMNFASSETSHATAPAMSSGIRI